MSYVCENMRWTCEIVYKFHYWRYSIVAKIYKALLLNCIEPKIEKMLRKNQNEFCRNQSITSQILTNHRILESVRAKNLKATLYL